MVGGSPFYRIVEACDGTVIILAFIVRGSPCYRIVEAYDGTVIILAFIVRGEVLLMQGWWLALL